jgi:hypothetical protein
MAYPMPGQFDPMLPGNPMMFQQFPPMMGHIPTQPHMYPYNPEMGFQPPGPPMYFPPMNAIPMQGGFDANVMPYPGQPVILGGGFQPAPPSPQFIGNMGPNFVPPHTPNNVGNNKHSHKNNNNNSYNMSSSGSSTPSIQANTQSTDNHEIKDTNDS